MNTSPLHSEAWSLSLLPRASAVFAGTAVVAASVDILLSTARSFFLDTSTSASSPSTSFPKIVLALIDNGGHGAIAMAAWLGIACLEHQTTWLQSLVSDFQSLTSSSASPQRLLSSPTSILNTLLCGFFACILDVDHFIAARKLSIHAASSLSSRPFGHCVLFIIVCVFAVWLMGGGSPSSSSSPSPSTWRRIHKIFPSHLWLLLLIAWSTHHLRDSTRRGLWLFPTISLTRRQGWRRWWDGGARDLSSPSSGGVEAGAEEVEEETSYSSSSSSSSDDDSLTRFSHTPPVPYPLYLVLIGLAPLLGWLILTHIVKHKEGMSEDTIDDDDDSVAVAIGDIGSSRSRSGNSQEL